MCLSLLDMEQPCHLHRYAENQEMLTANDNLIRQQVTLNCCLHGWNQWRAFDEQFVLMQCQSETILELERRLRAYEGDDGKGTATVKKVCATSPQRSNRN